MQEKKNDSYPLGICQRLFNFIMSGGLKRVTLGQPPLSGAASMVAHQNKSSSKLNGEVMPVHYLDRDNSKDDDLGSQVGISFKKSDGLEEYWTQVVDKFDSSTYGPKNKASEKGGKKKGSETPRLKDLQGKSFQDIEPNQIPVELTRGLKMTPTVKDSAEDEKRKSKGKNDANPSTKNAFTLAMEDEKMKAKTPSPRKVRPFLGNINEISDEFIRSRKEAMSNLS